MHLGLGEAEKFCAHKECELWVQENIVFPWRCHRNLGYKSLPCTSWRGTAGKAALSPRKLNLLQMSERFIPLIGLLISLENIPLLCRVGRFFSVDFTLHPFHSTGAPPQGTQWENNFAIPDTDFSFWLGELLYANLQNLRDFIQNTLSLTADI